MRVAWGCLLVPPHSYNVINHMMSQESKHSVKTPQRQSLAALLSLALYFGLPYRFHVGGGGKEGDYCLEEKKWKPVPVCPAFGGVGREGKEAQTGKLTCLRSYSKSQRVQRDLEYQALLPSLAFSSRPTFSSNDFFSLNWKQTVLSQDQQTFKSDIPEYSLALKQKETDPLNDRDTILVPHEN